MTPVETIAHTIQNGVMSDRLISITQGKTRTSYALWSYQVDGYHIYYKFHKMISAAAAQELGHTMAEGLTADWRTQAALTRQINAVRNTMQEATATMPFGKYKGQRIDELTDLDYLCWLVNLENIDGWIRETARECAISLGCLVVGGYCIDPNSENRFNRNTTIIYNAIQNHENIRYVAEQNNGGLWSAYTIDLPTITVGHSRYGMCECLNIDNRARKAKGLTITIYDYEVVGGCRIQVNGFYVLRN